MERNKCGQISTQQTTVGGGEVCTTNKGHLSLEAELDNDRTCVSKFPSLGMHTVGQVFRVGVLSSAGCAPHPGSPTCARNTPTHHDDQTASRCPKCGRRKSASGDNQRPTRTRKDGRVCGNLTVKWEAV